MKNNNNIMNIFFFDILNFLLFWVIFKIIFLVSKLDFFFYFQTTYIFVFVIDLSLTLGLLNRVLHILCTVPHSRAISFSDKKQSLNFKKP